MHVCQYGLLSMQQQDFRGKSPALPPYNYLPLIDSTQFFLISSSIYSSLTVTHLRFKITNLNRMTDPRLFFASPLHTTPRSAGSADDTPIRLLEGELGSVVGIEGKKLFQQSTTNVKQIEGSVEHLKQNIGGSIKTAVRQCHHQNTPLESISNFSPYTIPDSTVKHSQSALYSQRKSQMHENIDSNKENIDGANINPFGYSPQQGYDPRELQRGKEFMLKPIRIYHRANKHQPNGQMDNQYLVPQCESSLFSEQIPFHESRFTNQPPLPSPATSRKLSGYQYALQQLQMLRENVRIVERVSNEFKPIYFDTSVVLSGEDELNESFLQQLRSGLMEVLESAQGENESFLMDGAKSDRIILDEFSSISYNYVKSEALADQVMLEPIDREESVIFSNDLMSMNEGFDDRYETPAGRYKYSTPHQGLSSHSQDERSPYCRNIYENRHNYSEQIMQIPLNVQLVSSKQLIAKSRRKNRQFQKSASNQSDSLLSSVNGQ